MILKFVVKVLLMPILVVTGVLWIITKAAVWMYGILHGFLGIAMAVFLVLFISFQEWANTIAMLSIAGALFAVLFLGVMIQELLGACNRGIWNYITA